MRALNRLLAAAVLAAPAAAFSQTPPQPPRCTVDVDALSFGTYSPLGGDTTAVGRLHIACVQAQGVRAQRPALRVLLTAGVSGDILRRVLKSGVNELGYNIYVDQSRTRIAGDGTAGTAPLQASPSQAGAVGMVIYNLYGIIPGRQMAPAGTYTDVLQIIVEF